MEHFLSLESISASQLSKILTTAVRLKKSKPVHALAGRSIALLFEKPSLRTRVSFEVAITELGGKPIYLGPQEIGLGKRESVADVSRNLGRWVHAVVARTYSHKTIEELAQWSTVPVVNALSDREHPCQGVGDLLTILEHKKRLKGVTLAFIGDGNNVCNSLLLGAAKTGMHMRVACPEGYEPDRDILRAAESAAKAEGGSIRILLDPKQAVAGADAVYTDVWVSMGFEAESEKRRRAFSSYRVDRPLMSKAAPGAIFMHCLPAHRGEEVTDEVMDGPQSVILDQAENRMHSSKSILLALLAPAGLRKTRRNR